MNDSLFEGWENKPIGSRPCTACKKAKPDTEFHAGSKPSKSKSTARTGKCKECRALMAKATKEAKRNATPPPPGYRCPICNAKRPSRITTTWDCDHDHRTGNFRGWLCRNCNSALGKIDTITKLKKAILYLENAQKKALPNNLFGPV